MTLNIYATLTDARRRLDLSSTQTADDDLLLALLQAASRLIDAYAGRRFYPVRQTVPYPYDDPALLLLHDDLLALHSLTNGDGSALSASVYHLHPAGTAVKSSVLLDRTQAVFTHDGDPVDAISVEGTWGFHPDWANAWASSGDSVQNNPLSSGATTLTVTDADAPRIDRLRPAFRGGTVDPHRERISARPGGQHVHQYADRDARRERHNRRQS